MPLPIVFSRRFVLGRAPTRGAPTDCLLSAFGPGKGTHKGRPYRLSSLGVWPWGGHPQGAPLPIVFSRRSALGRAPTRGAPTDCLLSAFGPGEGTHKGRPYRLSSLGVRPWEGHPQGAPLPIVFSRRSALGRAPTRGAPTDCLLSAFGPGEGTHKGRPYRLSSLGVFSRRWPWGGHPQGVPLPIVFSRRSAKGGRPYRLSSLGVRPWEGHPQGAPLPIVFSRRWPWGGHPQGVPLPIVFSRPFVRPWGGHPQGVPLPIVFSRRSALGRAPTRGAPTDCLLSAFCPGEGTHKGRPYRLSSLGVLPWGGHPQGAPLPIVFSRRLALRRAPTRGAPTDCLLSAFGPGKGTHKGRPYRLSSLGVRPWGGRRQGAPLPDSGSLTRFFLI